MPLQKWIHVVILQNNRSLDLWINGKLYHSKHLRNVPLEVTGSETLEILPNGGFSGYLSEFKYYPLPITRNSYISPYSILKNFRKGPIIKRSAIVKTFKKWTKSDSSDTESECPK